MPVEADVFFGQPRLCVKGVDLPGHGAKEWHGQPEAELRILPMQVDPQMPFIDHFDAFQGITAQIQPTRSGGVCIQFGGKPCPQLAQADDVIRHHFGNGRMNPRMRQPLDLIGVVGGRDRA